MKKEMGIFALGAIVAVVLLGATNALNLRADGIQFPDGSLQRTAFGGQFELVGITGAVSADLGHIGMTRKCQQEFGTSSRMCSSLEVAFTMNPPSLSAYHSTSGWVMPVIVGGVSTTDVLVVDATGKTFSGNSGGSCYGWSTTSSQSLGLTISVPNGDPEGRIGTGQCSWSLGVSCCSPASQN